MWLFNQKEKYVCFEFSQPILFFNPDPKVAITGKRMHPKAAAISRMETWFSLQCGKPFFSNTRQNGEWTETSTCQNEIELAMFGE